MDRHPLSPSDAMESDQSWWGWLCGPCYWPLEDPEAAMWRSVKGKGYGSEAGW